MTYSSRYQSCVALNGVSPIYRELWDAADGRAVPWSAVKIVDTER